MKTLFVDFDGVLHPSTTVLGKNMARLAMQGSQTLLNEGFFRWTHELEEALGGEQNTDVALVVHSSWRGQQWLSNNLLLGVLGPLGHRFSGCVGKEDPRERAIANFAMRMGIGDFLILDDATREFSDLQDHLIVTNPLLGVSDESLRARIQTWAHQVQPICAANMRCHA